MKMSAQTVILLGLIGLIAGVLSGLIGIGGGIILVPLLLWMGFSQQQAHGDQFSRFIASCCFVSGNQLSQGGFC